MARMAVRRRIGSIPSPPPDSTLKTGSRTIWAGLGSTDRYIAVTYKFRLGSNFPLDGLRRPRRPCRRVPVGLLLLPAWAATVGDACMADRPEANGYPDDEIRHELVLVMLAHITCDVLVLQGSTASRRVWCPRETNEVVACGTLQSTTWLVFMLVEQPCKSLW